MVLRFMLLALTACPLAQPLPVRAQSPQKWEDCWPIPTLAQEIAQLQQEQRITNPKPQVRVERLVFEGQTGLTSATLARVSGSLRKVTGGDADRNWQDELGERVRDAWQHHGYFLAKIDDPKALLIGETALEQRFAVTVPVHAGKMYRLDSIEFRKGFQLSTGAMRALFPIKSGDIFDTRKIQQGLESLRKAYGAKGFINLVLIPSTAVAEGHNRIRLLIDMDEGRLFHIAQIKILGKDTAALGKLLHESGIETGSVFDPSKLSAFFRRNKTKLPPASNAKEDVEWKIHEPDATVDLIFDFRECPQIDAAR